MKCHYEVLGLEFSVTDDEIKRAYRKLALKWHPDKNLESPSIAKEQFQLIQQAYEILSDPHERAWYDAHREAILKGGLGDDYKDDSIDLFRYFTTTCYRSYNDDEKGFYTVYRRVFETLAAEDLEFSKDLDSDEEPPNFGDSQSSYDDCVHNFYAYWQSYTTKRSYAWLDPHDIRSAPNRRISRLAEKENKKIRDKAKRERNELVRNLVAFVRKRDKRVKAHAEKLATRARENALKAEERKRAKLLERREELRAQRSCDWTNFDNIESELRRIEANAAERFGEDCTDERDRDEDESAELDALYCVACNKIFKTSKAFGNHENSKRHRDRCASLGKTIRSGESGPVDNSLDNKVEKVSTSKDKVSMSEGEFDSTDDEDCVSEKRDATLKKSFKATEGIESGDSEEDATKSEFKIKKGGARVKKGGATLNESAKVKKGGVTLNKSVKVKNKGVTSSEGAKVQKRGVSLNESAKVKKRGMTLNENFKVTKNTESGDSEEDGPRKVSEVENEGMTLKKSFKVTEDTESGDSEEDATKSEFKMKKNGVSSKEGAKVKKKGVTLNEGAKVKNRGVTSNEGAKVQKRGATPNESAKVKKRGMTLSESFKVTGDTESDDSEGNATRKESKVENEGMTLNKSFKVTGATGPEMPDFLLEPTTKVMVSSGETSEDELCSDDDEDDDVTLKNNFKITDVTEDEDFEAKEVIEDEDNGVSARKNESKVGKKRMTLKNNSKVAMSVETENSPLDDLYLYPQGQRVNVDENNEETSTEELISDQDDDDDEPMDHGARKKTKKVKIKVNPEVTNEEENFHPDLGLSKKQRRKRRNIDETNVRKETTLDPEDDPPETRTNVDDPENDRIETTAGKTKGKRAKEMRKVQKQRDEVVRSQRGKRDKKNIEVQDIEHQCVTCKIEFSSKNKLFDHLKKTGHSVYVPGKTKKSNEKKSRARGRSPSDSS